MKNFILCLIALFCAGCVYVSKTTLSAQAGKLVSPYGVLTNGQMNITREMTFGRRPCDGLQNNSVE